MSLIITKVHYQFYLEFQGCVNTHPDDACLLGGPLCSGQALDKTQTLRCFDLRQSSQVHPITRCPHSFAIVFQRF